MNELTTMSDKDMTIKEIAQVAGKTGRTINNWAQAAGEKISSVAEKISSAGHGKPARFNLEEVIEIIRAGGMHVFADLLEQNARGIRSDSRIDRLLSVMESMAQSTSEMMIVCRDTMKSVNALLEEAGRQRLFSSNEADGDEDEAPVGYLSASLAAKKLMIGRTRFLNVLREKGLIHDVDGRGISGLAPDQRLISRGYAIQREMVVNRSGGSMRVMYVQFTSKFVTNFGIHFHSELDQLRTKKAREAMENASLPNIDQAEGQ